MKTYTYDDVMKKAAAYGLLDSMSEADRNLTFRNPDAGMTVLQSRYDYKTATTDDARALAHSVAERTRQQYGGYSGGTDGSKFYITEKSPQNFTYNDVPSYSDPYADRQAALTDKVLNRSPYASAYGDLQKDLLQKVSDTANYRYDPAADDLYAAYAKEYRREGARATADALGQAASLTGGVPSTAAATAAAQAGQYYATKLSDKLPELAAAAEERNADRQAMLLNALSAANTADQTSYQRYLDDAALDYDNIELLRALGSDDYNRYRDELSQHNTDRDFAYGQFLDDLEYHQNLDANELAQKNYEEALAQSREEYRDQLNAVNDEQLWTAALYALEYLNDSSLLKTLIARMKEKN